MRLGECYTQDNTNDLYMLLYGYYGWGAGQ